MIRVDLLVFGFFYLEPYALSVFPEEGLKLKA